MVRHRTCLLNSRNVTHLAQKHVFKEDALVRMVPIKYAPTINPVGKGNLRNSPRALPRSRDCSAPLREVVDHDKVVAVTCSSYRQLLHRINLDDFVSKPRFRCLQGCASGRVRAFRLSTVGAGITLIRNIATHVGSPKSESDGVSLFA